MTNTLNIPQSPPIDLKTGDWRREWLLWIQNPSFQSINPTNPIPATGGGTGTGSIPSAGQILVGNGSGSYSTSSVLPAAALPALSGDVTNSGATVTLATVNSSPGSYGNATSVATFTVNAKGLVTLASTVSITGALSMTVVNGFGCNGKAAQNSAVVNAAIAGTAGAAYTAVEQGLINSLLALVNQLRAALVANGIAS